MLNKPVMNQRDNGWAERDNKPVGKSNLSWQTESIGCTEQEAIYKLWDRLVDFDAADSDKALDLFLRQICRWTGADNAFWVGAICIQRGARAKRDLLSGWRVGAMHMLDPGRINEQRQKSSVRKTNRADSESCETTRRLTQQAGQFRVVTLKSGELVDFEAFKKTDHYDWFYRQSNISDRMWVTCPLNPDTEAYYCFDKYGKRRQFIRRDMVLAGHAVRGIKWFHRQLHLSHGLGISEKALTPTERRVLQELLNGKTEKQIARRLGVTPGSAHQYAAAIYRKFGTRGRAELMALWLTRGASPSKAAADQ